uniref:Aminotransferase-like plant mobile domain-containing protein n=1 Tax=Fagus sylvatica TaxID=28930 RepID=A0A2N9G023_FAGSY
MTMPTSWGSLVSFPLSCGFKLIVACSRLLLLSGTRPIVAFPLGKVDLVPTLEEYAELLQLDSPFSETPVIPIQGPRSNRCLEKYLGLTTAVLRPEIARPEETWRKANISLGFADEVLLSEIDLGVIPLVFSEGRSIIPAILCETVRSLSYCRRQGEGVPMFCTQLLQLWFCSHLRHFYRLQTPYHFERHTVSQTVKIALPFTGNSRDWALYLLLDLPLGEWSWKVTWGPAVWRPLDSLCPLRWSASSWGVGLYGLLSQPCSSEDMWRLLSRVEVIWEGRLSEVVLIEEGLLYGQAHHLFFGVSLSSGVSLPTGQPERVTVLERELEEGSNRASLCGVPCITTVWRWRTFAATWRLRGGNVSTLRTMNEFIREQLEISEDAKESAGGDLGLRLGSSWRLSRRRGLGVQDELDSLRSYTQALVDPATGRPQDIVALRRALDASEEALTSARTSMGVMRVQISVLQGDNGVLQTELDLVHDALES